MDTASMIDALQALGPIQTLPRTSCSSGSLSVPGMSMSPISHWMVPGRNSRESGTSAGFWKGVPHGSGQYATSCYPSSRERVRMRSSSKAVSRQAAERAGSSHTLPQQASIGVTWNLMTMELPGDPCRRWSHSAYPRVIPKCWQYSQDPSVPSHGRRGPS
jgi:hypothetical protein